MWALGPRPASGRPRPRIAPESPQTAILAAPDSLETPPRRRPGVSGDARCALNAPEAPRRPERSSRCRPRGPREGKIVDSFHCFSMFLYSRCFAFPARKHR
eukprot:8203708-Pyramimonas_sp.AAC.1